MSRRTVLAGAIGGGALLATGFTAGCSSGSTEDTVRAAFASGNSQENLDPHVLPLFVSQARARACFDTLTGWSQQMTATPRLAQSWESDPTGKIWRIRLRDTKFHDGRPFTGDDVLYSFRRIADPATSGTAANLFSGIDFAASHSTGPHEVQIVLTAPNFLFPLSWAAPGAEIVPQGTTSFATPIGTGPYRFVSFTPGGPASYTAYDRYWDGAPPTGNLEFVPVADESARLAALLSGQVAYAFDLRAASAAQVSGNHRVRLLDADNSTYQFLPLKVDRPPFSDPRMREAVRYGIDRPALVRTVLLGKGRVGNDLYGRGLEYYDTTIPQVTRDVSRARALVSEAGAGGTKIELLTSTADPNFEAAAGLIARQLGEIGLQVTPRTLPPDTYYPAIRSQGVAAMNNLGSFPMSDYVSRRLVSSLTDRNYTGFRDPQIDALSAAALATPDDSARAGIYRQIQQIVRDDSGLLVWASSDSFVGVTSDISGIEAARPNTERWARFDKARLG